MDGDDREVSDERALIAMFHKIHQRPEGADRSDYVDDMLLDRRVEVQIQELSQKKDWSHWMQPLALLAISLGVELGRLRAVHDINLAGATLAASMHNTLVYCGLSSENESSGECSANVASARRMLDNVLESAKSLPYNKDFTIHLEFAMLMAAVLNHNGMPASSLEKSIELLQAVKLEMEQSLEGGDSLMKTADSLVASLEKLRHRRSHLRSCELAIVNRAFTIPYSEWGIEIGEKGWFEYEYERYRKPGKILVDIRQPHYLETYGDGEAESHEPPPALQALLTLLDTTTGLSAAAKSMILQEVVLLQMANKTANLESVLSKVSALLPSKDDDMAHWTAERVLKLWEPFINLLHDNDHYKHALPSTWLDFERVRRPLVAMYRAASTPTPASAPAVGHVDATLCYLSSLNPSLRLLCRLLRSMLAAKGVLHFVQALNVTHGETLYTENRSSIS